MIDIITIKGEKYGFDENTQIIFKDGVVIPKTVAEPVYSGPNLSFSGILLKTTKSVLSLNGNINPVTNITNI